MITADTHQYTHKYTHIDTNITNTTTNINDVKYYVVGVGRILGRRRVDESNRSKINSKNSK